MPTGYSGTPLAKKLSVNAGQLTWRYAMPARVAEEIARTGVQPELLKCPKPGLQMAHLFVTRRADLARRLAAAREHLDLAGIIWVSWPKKSGKVPTDVTDHIVREEAFSLGLVDIKVCAVDETWSGLKLMIRLAKRV